jgi:fructoselysine-6-P-deglycase FrlB-like protein
MLEIESQPALWERAAALAATGELSVLPEPGVPVLVIGCGTSYYIGDCYAQLRTRGGLGPTRAVVPAELVAVEPGETVLLLSRSGTTGDVLRLGRAVAGRNRTVAIVGTPGSPIDTVADTHVVLGWADEQSVVQTRFATTALTALRASLGEDLSGLAAQGALALAAPLPAPELTHLVFLGTGWTLGLAHEAALKCREAAGAWTEAYPIAEYEHGPISCAGPRSLVFSFGPVPVATAAAIRATGATLEVAELDPQAELVRLQRQAVAMAGRAGRDPDHPPHLNRSVQLPS